MRISHKHKFVFLSNPRCGSTSVREVLARYADIASTDRYPYHHHTGARALKSHFDDQGWRWSDYTVITTVRNPWARVVSLWRYGQKNPDSVWRKHVEAAGSFGVFVEELASFMKNRVYAGTHAAAGQYGMSIDQFAYSLDGDRLVHHILPIETIDQTLPPLIEKLGLPSAAIPRVNGTKGGEYHNYYNGEERIVGEMFEPDIKEFGYTFWSTKPEI